MTAAAARLATPGLSPVAPGGSRARPRSAARSPTAWRGVRAHSRARPCPRELEAGRIDRHRSCQPGLTTMTRRIHTAPLAAGHPASSSRETAMPCQSSRGQQHAYEPSKDTQRDATSNAKVVTAIATSAAPAKRPASSSDETRALNPRTVIRIIKMTIRTGWTPYMRFPSLDFRYVFFEPARCQSLIQRRLETEWRR